MKIISEQSLINEVHNAFTKIKKRMWIAVPFIGNTEQVSRIMGTNWRFNPDIDFRLLTDIRNSDYINKETYELFKQYATIKTLAGLHAKIYILDNRVFVTSANLTGAAFTKRYEIGVMLDNSEDTIETFEHWWSIAKPVATTWSPQSNRRKSQHAETEESDTENLRNLWKLPNIKIQGSEFKDYFQTLAYYNDFAQIYEQYGVKLSKRLSLYQEVDLFFNYLFHEENQPSKPYYKEKEPEALSKAQQIVLFKRYFKTYTKWLETNTNYLTDRIRNISIVRTKLTENNIDSISRDDVRTIVNCLNCMNSRQLNKYKFLNPQNNSIEDIIKYWKILLFDSEVDITKRMQKCKNGLYSFGKSSIRELIAFHKPNEYPIINTNSNSGLRFFGYQVKTY